MIDLDRQTIVASQFRGQARQFRDRVGISEKAVGICFKTVVDDLAVRYRGKPRVPPRPDQCAAWINRLRSVANFGRLAFVSERSQRGFKIFDTRLMSCRVGCAEWTDGESETGLATMKLGFDFTIDRSRGFSEVRYPVGIIAMFNQHALARFYQRCLGDRSDAALIAALSAPIPFVAATQKMALDLKHATPFVGDKRIAVTGRAWLGHFGQVGAVDKQVPMMLRTFI